jgi:polyribonucleotide nucleotidyltransferase
MKEKKFINTDHGYEVTLGVFAQQADGSVWIKHGGTVVLAAVTSEISKEFPGFFPLSVDYREHYAAVGKIPGGYFKREGKPTDKEVLMGRAIDRCIRPLFPKNYFNKVSLVVTVYSVDKDCLPSNLVVIASSLAISISKIPFLSPVGACEIAKGPDGWISSPTHDQIMSGTARILVAGNENGINMVEGALSGSSETDVVDALFFAHEEIKKQVIWQKTILSDFKDIKKDSDIDEFDIDGWTNLSDKYLTEDKVNKIFINNKLDRENQKDILWNNFLKEHKDLIEEKKISESIIKYAFSDTLKNVLINLIFTKNSRIDGRGFDEIREISSNVSLLPKNHGSALFTRGGTQLLVSTTLGSGDDEIRLENLIDEPANSLSNTFMLHYNFLPFSVGEAKALRGPGKREIGHGYLATNAVKAILPEKKKFPYTIRLVADVLGSDGSSSMATVCGATLSLMDAGVPIKSMVAGIAMGTLISKDNKFKILTDIAGIEDEFGFMDLKIAGTEREVTAIQMDIKYKDGLKKDFFVEAFEKARKARLSILETMKKTLSGPREKLSDLVPKFETFYIPKDKIGAVIGSGGKVIREITEKTGTSINIEDDGLIKIFGTPGINFDRAVTWVKMIAGEVVVGSKFEGTVKKITDFGYFVELFPNFDGLVHISTIPRSEQESFKTMCKEGDKLKVIIVDYDQVTGRIRLKVVR